MTGADLDEGPASSFERDTVGVLRLGGARLALSLGILREVLPCPDTLEPLPVATAGTGLLGATNLRGSVLPVLDLRPLLGWPDERDRTQIVAVAALGDRVLGLLCDEVLGVCRLADVALQRLRGAEDGLLFSHSFERPEDGAIVSVLDVDRMFALPGVPAAEYTDGVALQPTHTAGRPAASGAEHVIVRCDHLRFALEVEHVHALLPDVRLSPSPLSGPLCIGVTPYGTRSIAAVDPLRMVGLGELSRAGEGGGLILRFPGPDGDGFVALLLSEVLEIARVAEDELLPLPAVMGEGAGWFRGLSTLAGGGDFLVLDAGRLTADPALAALAALNVETQAAGVPAQRTDPDGRDAAAAATSGVGESYLTYVAGRELATPLLQVSEIVLYPREWIPVRTEEPALLGVHTYRGAVVPLICLSTLLTGSAEADPTTDPGSRVVVVTVPDGTVGFVVPALRAIELSTWEEETDRPDEGPPETPADAIARSHVVRVGGEGEDRNVRTLDLATLATVLTARPHQALESGLEPYPELEG